MATTKSHKYTLIAASVLLSGLLLGPAPCTWAVTDQQEAPYDQQPPQYEEDLQIHEEMEEVEKNSIDDGDVQAGQEQESFMEEMNQFGENDQYREEQPLSDDEQEGEGENNAQRAPENR